MWCYLVAERATAAWQKRLRLVCYAALRVCLYGLGMELLRCCSLVDVLLWCALVYLW